MRPLASFLLCSFALGAGAAEIWRWKDANGVVHYSDNPVAGAERIVMDTPGPAAQDEAAPGAQPAQPEAPPVPLPPFAYTACEITSPANEQDFQGVQPVAVNLRVEPGLQPGHRIQVFVNGQQRSDWPANSTSYTFAEVFRGSYTLNARILDAGGRTLCAGPTITFHLRQPGLLSPQGAQRPAGSTAPSATPAPGVTRGNTGN
jgi:hypothetical protein